MSLISLVIVLIVVGVLLWAVNTFGASFIDGKILKIINIVVVIFVVLWLIRVGRIR
jgi:hypothetical protein